LSDIILSFRARLVKKEILRQLSSKYESRHTLIVSRNVELTANFQNATEGLYILFLVGLLRELHQTPFPYQIFGLRTSLAQTAYNHRYNGHWNTVQDILEREPTLQGTIEGMLLNMNEDEIFGNIVPRAGKFAFRLKQRRFSSVKGDTRPVRRKVRRRGYDDKGTLLPPHKKLPKEGLPPGEPRHDRRNNVQLKDPSPPINEGHENLFASGAFPDDRSPEGSEENEVRHCSQEAISWVP